MKRYCIYTCIFILCIISVCLWGCSRYTGVGTNQPKETGIQGLEEVPDLSYDVPEQVPGILTDMSGYETQNRKVVMFHGKKLPEQFHVVDVHTGEVVFTADLTEKAYSTNTDEYNSYGDFSALQTPGEYYIQCELLGRSYSFVIRENLYEEVFSEAFLALSDAELRKETDASLLCNAAAAMLLSYELYPQAYGDGIFSEPNEIPDVLDEVALMIAQLSKIQDTQTGKVGEITDSYAGVLAKFSYLYQNYDSTYATECLKAADLAWKYTASEQEERSREQHFFAAAELYRATGQYKYHQEAKECASLILEQESFPDDYALYGAVTYLSTKRKVDVGICTELMQMIMSMAEDIINSSKASFYAGYGEKEDLQGILSRMMLLSVADFISTNQEYAVIIENQYHYVNGRNPWSENLLEDANLQHKGYLLMSLSQMLQADLSFEE